MQNCDIQVNTALNNPHNIIQLLLWIYLLCLEKERTEFIRLSISF